MEFDLSEHAPTYIVVLGDIHCNTRWTLHAVETGSKRLDDLGEPRPHLFLQAGDAGIWGDKPGLNFRQQVDLMLAARGAELIMVRGNHEAYNLLIEAQERRPPEKRNAPIPLSAHFLWLPDGYRWRWHDRTWVAIGGAVSPDRSVRTPGFDWFPEEVLSYSKAADICNDGTAEVVLAHDIPRGAYVRYMNPPPSCFAPEDLRRSEQHRDLMRSVAEEIKPSHWIGGHYHQGGPWWVPVDMHYGGMLFTVLDMDGRDGNIGVLNVKTMKWSS